MGLCPLSNFFEEAPYFNEANLVLICKKIYGDYIAPQKFFSEEIKEHYPKEDYHKFYIGEIIKVLKKDE